MESLKKGIFHKIVLLLVTAVISFIVLEYIIRIIFPSSPYHPLLLLYPNNKIELHINLKGLSPVATHSTNSWGLRGDDPPSPSEWKKYYTIVSVGGSTTQCFYLDDHKTWPYLLQERLKKKYFKKVWVGNGGLLGHTTRAHIIFMREIIPKINPDAVILLVGINDLGFSITKNSGNCGSPYDYYKPGWKRRFFFNSRLLQILYKGGLVIFNQVAVEKKSVPQEFRPKPLTDISMILPNDLKILLPCLNQYRENVKEIIRLAKSMKTRIILLTQPAKFI